MTGTPTTAPPRRRWPFVVTLLLGFALLLAPLAFGMFDRAPRGADMIDAFRPSMTEARIVGFQRDMATIGDAVAEAKGKVPATGAASSSTDSPYAAFLDRWPAIDADMSEMLTTMRRDVPKFAAVDSLPDFVLFPWFFVIPGLLVVGASIWELTRRRPGSARTRGRGPAVALIVIGAGLIAAPAVFQMFTRAPSGGEMIDDFRPLMTRAKVQTIQGYFLTIGAGEGTLRNQVLPALGTSAGPIPAIARFEREWPGISNRMAPMIGAMSDNVSNYEAVEALPPFPLFPWFFVIPGVLIAGCAFAGTRRGDRALAASDPPAWSLPSQHRAPNPRSI